MAKRYSTDLVGYVVGLSPRKTNKTFHAQIQTNEVDRPRRAICFDKDKHEVLTLKKTSGDSVKLKNIVVQETPNNGFADLIINTKTVIDDMDPVNVAFDRREPEATIINLDDELAVGSLVSLKAIIDLSHSTERTVSVGAKSLRVMNNAFLHNDSGDIAFSLWEEWIDYFKQLVASGSNYVKFRNLLVREFNNEISLSMCAETDCEVLAEEPQNSVLLNDDEVNCAVSAFDSVSIQYDFACAKCSKFIRASSEALIKCSSCKTTTRATKLTIKVTVLAKSDDLPNKTGYYSLDIAGLEKRVPCEMRPISFETDGDKLIEAVMALADVSMLVNVKNNTVAFNDGGD